MKKLLIVFSVIAMGLTCLSGLPSVTTGLFTAKPIIPAPGELYSVSLASTLDGIRSCLAGEFGTGIFQNPARPDALIFMWRVGNQAWSFVGLNIDNKHMVQDLMSLRANYSSIKDYDGLIKALSETGWVSVSYKFVEGSIRNPVLMATINQILEGISSKFVTILLMPVGVDPSQIGAIHYELIPDEARNQ